MRKQVDELSVSLVVLVPGIEKATDAYSRCSYSTLRHPQYSARQGIRAEHHHENADTSPNHHENNTSNAALEPTKGLRAQPQGLFRSTSFRSAALAGCLSTRRYSLTAGGMEAWHGRGGILQSHLARL